MVKFKRHAIRVAVISNLNPIGRIRKSHQWIDTGSCLKSSNINLT